MNKMSELFDKIRELENHEFFWLGYRVQWLMGEEYSLYDEAGDWVKDCSYVEVLKYFNQDFEFSLHYENFVLETKSLIRAKGVVYLIMNLVKSVKMPVPRFGEILHEGIITRFRYEPVNSMFL